MAQKRLGIVVSAPDSSAVLTSIANLEQRGIQRRGSRALELVAPIPSAPSSGPPCARNTTCWAAITQTFPRHPIAVVQQVQVLAQLAPGRFRLGLGTSGRAGWSRPMGSTSAPPWATCRNIYVSSRPCSTPDP